MKIINFLAAAVTALCLTACADVKDTDSSPAASSAKADSSVYTAEEESSPADDAENSSTNDSSGTNDNKIKTESSEAEEVSQAVPEESSAEDIPAVITQSDESNLAHVQGVGYSVDFDLSKWIDVTDQASALADANTAEILAVVYGWKNDYKSSCTVAVSDADPQTSAFTMQELCDALRGQADSKPGQTILSNEVLSINGRDWIRCEYALSADVYGVDARSIQYHTFSPSIQLTLSFSVLTESDNSIQSDIDEIISSVVIE